MELDKARVFHRLAYVQGRFVQDGTAYACIPCSGQIDVHPVPNIESLLAVDAEKAEGLLEHRRMRFQKTGGAGGDDNVKVFFEAECFELCGRS